MTYSFDIAIAGTYTSEITFALICFLKHFTHRKDGNGIRNTIFCHQADNDYSIECL